MRDTPSCILVMGVSGSGKSHIGKLLAKTLGMRYIDADDHHGPENIAKMARGEPLDDDDRREWLITLADLYSHHQREAKSLVISCSALKRDYRDRLRQAAPQLKILYLHGSRELLLKRLGNRRAHFFAGEHMLNSQLATLEPPDETEAFRCDIRLTPREIVAAFSRHLASC
ncbi:gluconokinase [Pistricoccus aurantiacus]|uniref:Gluconokinase n=1 Tax=Pistricoccus aurantiacus TaxID=1883414 RepID=A0A5B8T0X5_9GAMM|nr:gluconokinase [Pistricoccus aurantiacus]QEA40708.1 gluconokinase [Pistricoccus aurantiacus]